MFSDRAPDGLNLAWRLTFDAATTKIPNGAVFERTAADWTHNVESKVLPGGERTGQRCRISVLPSMGMTQGLPIAAIEIVELPSSLNVTWGLLQYERWQKTQSKRRVELEQPRKGYLTVSSSQGTWVCFLC